MIPGKNQITIVEAEIQTLSGPVQGFIRVQSEGIFLGENRSMEVGVTWPELLRLLEHPDVAQELAAHSVGFLANNVPSR